MQDIDEIGKTAFIIATYRAEEAEHERPLFEDPHARLFADEAFAQAAVDHLRILPVAQTMVRLRTRYLNDALRRRMDEGVRQVIVLGAGFDTRALHPGNGAARFFEIDRSAVLAYKAERLRGGGIEPRATAVACDYVAEDFIEALRDAGLDSAAPTHVIWEGNTAYLTMAEAVRTLSRMAGALVECTVSLDYLSDSIVAGTTGVAAIAETTRLFASMGSPWVTGFADIGEVAVPGGFRVIDDIRTADLAREYNAMPKKGAEILELYSVCTIERHGGN